MRSTVLALLCVLSGIVGCSAEAGSEGSSSERGSKSATGKTAQASRWSCETQGKEVVCSAPQALSAGEAPAYACKAGEVSEKCPDQQAVDKCDGLGDLLNQGGGGGDAFNNSPWACLATGAHQTECVRQVGGEEGGAGKPTPPEGTCDVGEWQKYFGEQASYEYQQAGVDITFPAGIFDANKSIVEAALSSGGVPGAGGGIPGGGGLPGIPGLPGGGGIPGAGGGGNESTEGGGGSCHAGEWSMRRQSWLDVVLKGCMAQLAMPNTVWCQQAANYAPTTGACTATGTW